MLKWGTQKIFCFLLCLVLCLVICACENNPIYKKQQEIMFNYNNISAGMSSYWLENDAAFYIKHNVGFDIYKATDKGSEKIASTNDPTVNIQVYGNDIYFVASETDVYVSFLEKQKIVHYSSDGISETVLS